MLLRFPYYLGQCQIHWRQQSNQRWLRIDWMALLANGTTAVVTFNAGTSSYDVEITLNGEAESATITVTEAS